MVKLHSQKLKKLIISIIVVIMLCNFVMPNYIYAISTESGGSYIGPLGKFLCFIPDAANNLMQHMFVSKDNIRIKDVKFNYADMMDEALNHVSATQVVFGVLFGSIGVAVYQLTHIRETIQAVVDIYQAGTNRQREEYRFLYSPGIIFSGLVPAFDIDFIGADSSYKSTGTGYVDTILKYKDCIDINTNTDQNVKIDGNPTIYYNIEGEEGNCINNYYDSASDAFVELAQTGRLIKNNGELVKIYEPDTETEETEYTYKANIDLNTILKGFDITANSNSTWELVDSTNAIEYSTDDKEDGLVSENPQFVFNQVDGVILIIYLTNVDIKGNRLDVQLEFNYRVKKISLKDENGGVSKEVKIELFEGQGLKNRATETTNEKGYSSSAAVLQPLISRWYKAFRRIALVGLLSALVYIGIRIVLSSTSAQDKAKYKKMLKDWFVALCLLFVLHYIMHLTVTVVKQVNNIIGANLVGENGEDILLTTLRNRIAAGGSWSVIIAEVIIYDVITVFTVIYTIQYLRRTIYLAFLTMIAPLITLTYPLDKIKDSKSQAFDMWLKDYLFFTLLQVFHLLLYYVLVGQAMDLANKGSWLYALVTIGFITQAEKIVKKMFGFEKSRSMGALAAGATGALVMNAINKMSVATSKIGGKSGGAQGSGKGGSAGKVRTASSNPLSGLIVANGMNQETLLPETQGATPQRDNSQEEDVEQEGTLLDNNGPEEPRPEEQRPEIPRPEEPMQEQIPQEENQEGQTPQGRPISFNVGQPGGGATDGDAPDMSEQAEIPAGEGTQGGTGGFSMPTGRPRQNTNPEQNGDQGSDRDSDEIRRLVESLNWPREDVSHGLGTIRTNNRADKLDITGFARGTGAVLKRYGGTSIRKLGGAFLGITGATIGFAAGVAQGDIGKAVTGGAAGAAAGYYGGQKIVGAAGKVVHTATHLNEPVNKVVDTYNEGARGEEYVQNKQADREFYSSEAYQKLKSDHPEVPKRDIQKMLNAGITDTKNMDKILKKVKKQPNRYNLDKAIAYSALAKKCPETIMYDDEKFIKYMADKKINISAQQVKQLRRNIVEFR